MAPPSVCRHCGSSEIEKDPARCDVVCTRCGSVLEEGAIVSEVQFEEGDGGRVIGQFVSSDGTNSTHLQGFGGMYYGESRTATLQNGKRHIEELASRLRLSQHFVEIAYNFYKLAVVRRLTRGHRLTHIIAACLYLACRLESTQHMLLDFSDALQADVYALGHAYLYITNKLAINPPAMDPCIYVSRFAHRMELGEKTHEVSITALRLVSRMKKDWIHTGRRPSGLCGAALMIACRIHGFNRGVDDIIRVVKVCQATVMKRLLEFANTESSNLTVEEFNRVDLETEEDPPAFARSKAEHEAKQLAAADGTAQQVDYEKYEADLVAVHREIERVLSEAEVKRRRFMYRRFGLREEADFDQVVDACESELGTGGAGQKSAVTKASITDPTAINSEKELEMDLDEEVAFIEKDIDEILRQEGGAYKLRPTLISLGLAPDPNAAPVATSNEQTSSAEKPQTETSPKKATANKVEVELEEDEDDNKEMPELDTEGLDDAELEGYLLKPAEVKVRTILWTKLNADYLKEVAEKAQKLREEEAERIKNGGDPADANANKAKSKKRRSRKIQPQATPGQAIEVLVQRKKLSSKIDYEKLKSLMPGGAPSSAAPPMTPETSQKRPSVGETDDQSAAKTSKVEITASSSVLASRFAEEDEDYGEEEEEEEEGDDEDGPRSGGGGGGGGGLSAAQMLAQFSGGSYAADGGGDDYDV